MRAGLKPYDLVWVKDRSAAWRYPSEIPELQAYAPVVEEQPYDRFYKKQVSTVEPTVAPVSTQHAAPLPQVATRVQPEPASVSNEQYPIVQASAEQPDGAAVTVPPVIVSPVTVPSVNVSPATVPSVTIEREPAKPDPVRHAGEPVPQAPISNPIRKSVYVNMPAASRGSSVPATTQSQPQPQSQPQLQPQPERKVETAAPLPGILVSGQVAATSQATSAQPGIASAAPTMQAAAPTMQATAPTMQAAEPTMQAVAPTIQAAPPKMSAATPQNPTVPSEYSKYDGSGAQAEIKFAQPLDEIKERYVKTLADRKVRMAKNDQLKGYALKAAIVVGVVGAIFLANSLFSSRDAETPAVVAEASLPTTPDAPVNAETNEDTNTETAAVSFVPAPTHDNQIAAGQLPATPDEIAESSQQPSAPAKQVAAPAESTRRTVLFDEDQFAHNNSITNAETGERTKKSRDEQPEKTDASQAAAKPAAVIVRPAAREWEGQVSVSSNDYKRVAFGGIRNLLLTVTNHSKKELQNVIVQVDYLKPSEEPLKSEQIRFRNIEADASSTIRVPDTNRGIKVSYRIVQVVPAGTEAVAGN